VTDSVSGYRTLAQLGAGSGSAAGVPPFGAQPAQPAPPAPELPPFPAIAPRFTPLATTPSYAREASSYDDLLRFEPVDPRVAKAAERDAKAGADLPRDGYQLPFIGLRLPGIRRTLDELPGDFLAYHPNDPDVRMTGQHNQPQPAPQPSGEGGEAGKKDGGERSGLAKTAMMVGIGGGLVANALDITRTVAKYPEALRAGRFDPSLGRLGRFPTALGLTAAMRPDARLVDPMAPRIATVESLGKSFTRFDEIAMKSSVLLGTSLAALQLASAIPNLSDALSKDGPWYSNIAQSTSGRAGVLQLAGGGLGLAVFMKALQQTKGSGATGLVDTVMAAAKAPIMAKPIFTTVGLASGALVMANELGYLDFLNTGEERPVGTVLKDAAHSTPVLNDAEFRTGALLLGGGVLGYKIHRAISAAGGLSGLSKGHIIGGIAVAGLLGAQLLGGLDVLNKPAES
jgi:hypothetical protein